MTKTFSTKTAGVGLTAVYKEKFAAKTIHASSCNILRMIFLALGVDGFHRNQCIRVIMQQEFARELREISSVFAFWCWWAIKRVVLLSHVRDTHAMRHVRLGHSRTESRTSGSVTQWVTYKRVSHAMSHLRVGHTRNEARTSGSPTQWDTCDEVTHTMIHVRVGQSRNESRTSGPVTQWGTCECVTHATCHFLPEKLLHKRH